MLDNVDRLNLRLSINRSADRLSNLEQTQHTGIKPLSAFGHTRVEFLLWVALLDAPHCNQHVTAGLGLLSPTPLKNNVS